MSLVDSYVSGAPAIRHETQKGALCLKHTLNNLLQSPHFTKRALDGIARELSPSKLWIFNPHSAPFSGDYDVNVMMAALAGIGKDMRWHDARDTAFETVDPSACWALILNSDCDSGWPRITRAFRSGRHYSGLKKLHGVWWHMDSREPFAQQVTFASDRKQEALELRHFLQRQQAQDPSLHVFVITEMSAED